jgi:hypothetical protein
MIPVPFFLEKNFAKQESFSHLRRFPNDQSARYGISLGLDLPTLGGLLKKKSLLPVAASAYWSIATMIA